MFFRLYAVALPLFLILDGLWLGLVAKEFYRRQIGGLMKDNVNWIAVAVFYLLYVGALTFFVLLPAMEKKSLPHAALAGAFFGLVCYATYDLTNLAVTKDWTVTVTAVDMLWGTAASCVVSAGAVFIMQKLS